MRTVPPTPAERPRRRDAQRNRGALTEAAAAAFQEQGLDIAVDEIARRAGVGVATLYRHFPTKLDLILAVTATVLDELEAAASAALAAPDPSEALAVLLSEAMAQQRENRGFLEAIAQHGLPDDARAEMAARVVAMLEPVVDVAHAAQTLDRSLDATDLLVAMRMLGATAATPDPRPGDRYLAVVLGGLAHPRG
jgi:AcrR family transcriptional regulator